MVRPLILAGLLSLALAPAVHAQSGVPTVPEGYGATDAESAPSPEPPATTYRPPGADVTFSSSDAHPPTIHVRRDGEWRRLCTAPCTQRLGFGQYELALSLFESEPVAIGRPTAIGVGTLSLDAHYDDGSHAHELGTGLLIGGLVLAGGVGGGLAGATALFFAAGAIAGVVTLLFSIVGFAAGLALVITGLVLLDHDPSAQITQLASSWPGD